jgi:hypothetical protein
VGLLYRVRKRGRGDGTFRLAFANEGGGGSGGPSRLTFASKGGGGEHCEVVVTRFVSRLRTREMEDVVVVRSFRLAFASEGGGRGRGCELVVCQWGSRS